MRHILVLGAGITAAVATVVGIAGAAGPANSGLDRKGAAQKILKLHGKYLSSPAQSAVRMVANDDRELAPPQQALSGGARSGGLAAGPAAFTNVRVNDPALDSHQVDQTTQSETSVAVAGSRVAVGYNDSQHTGLFLTAGSGLSGYSYSTDGGAGFTDGDVLPNRPEFVNLGDPWLTSDRAGNMYYSTLAFDLFNFNLDVAVAKSTDGGKTWSDPVPVTRPPFEIFYTGDKDAIAAGRDPSQPARDNLYVAYDDFSFDSTTGDFFIGLPVARSTNGGASWQISYADKTIRRITTRPCRASRWSLEERTRRLIYIGRAGLALSGSGRVGLRSPFEAHSQTHNKLAAPERMPSSASEPRRSFSVA